MRTGATSTSITSPVDLRRNSRRSSRYSCPRRRAARTSAGSRHRLLERQQAFEDPDRGPERRDRRAVLGLAVPAAVGELLPEQPVHQRADVLAEVGADRDDDTVDARLDLAGEERVAGPLVRRVPALPGDMVPHELGRPPGLRALGVEPQKPQQLERVHRVRPVVRPGAARPPAVVALQREQPRAPPLGRDLRPLRRDDALGFVREVPHDRPADRGVGVQQPVDDVHARASVSFGSGDRPTPCCGAYVTSPGRIEALG